MIINTERDPHLSLYFLGALILRILKGKNNLALDDIYEKMKSNLDVELSIDYFYYALDWLYLESLIEYKDGRVKYVNKKITSIRNGRAVQCG